MTNKKIVSVLVGQLLVESGMLERELLDIALDRARVNGVKIGQILLYSGLIGDRELKAALMAQRMLRQSLISFKQAVEALIAVRESNIDHETALARARWLHSSEQIHQFAKLMMDIGLLTTDQLGSSLAISIKHGFALGRVLMVHNRISVEVRKSAIDAIILTRCGDITYEHAVAAMKAVLRTGHSVRELLGLEASPVNVISEELVRAGVLTEFEVLDIIEEALQRATLLKGIVGQTLIANLKFAASLAINRMVGEGTIGVEHAQSLCHDLLLSTSSALQNTSNELLEPRKTQLIA